MIPLSSLYQRVSFNIIADCATIFNFALLLDLITVKRIFFVGISSLMFVNIIIYFLLWVQVEMCVGLVLKKYVFSF